MLLLVLVQLEIRSPRLLLENIHLSGTCRDTAPCIICRYRTQGQTGCMKITPSENWTKVIIPVRRDSKQRTADMDVQGKGTCTCNESRENSISH